MPRLLDLFCGAGGCSMGYHRAGFDVVGVDINPQKNYPFEFHQADAMTFPIDGFDVVHASPPCQGYMPGELRRGQGKSQKPPRLIDEVRDRISVGAYVIENVPAARHSMHCPFMLCGGMFGLGVVRHRYFECSNLVMIPPHVCNRPFVDSDAVSVTGHGPPPRWYKRNPGKSFSVDIWKTAMGVDWMTRNELRNAIPPAYTEFIGQQLI